MRSRILPFATLLIGATPLFAQPSPARIELIKPTAEELRWQEIPWEPDPATALKLAKQEQRPIFFWAAGGRKRDGLPLERC